ncbi:UNVERIFIED_CONTAM: hypothetical protein FKN15_027408 [Acipenser sinensis]
MYRISNKYHIDNHAFQNIHYPIKVVLKTNVIFHRNRSITLPVITGHLNSALQGPHHLKVPTE